MEKSKQRILLTVTTVSGFLSTFTASSVNIALPMIAADFRLSAVTLGWISLTYVLGMAALLMPSGRMADIRGRKAVYMAGSVAFTIFSLALALSPSGAFLLGLRVLQGVSAAMLFSTATVLVILAYPAERRGRAIGIQVAGVYLGMTLGPVLGGVIAQNAGWRALFVIVGALSLVNTVVPFFALRGLDWREPRVARFDIEGSVIWAVSLPLLLFGFSYLPSLTGIALIVAGAAGLAFFLWWENRAADPILNVTLMRSNRVFAFSNMAALINYAATFAMTMLMSLYLQYNRGLSEQRAGLVLVTGFFVQAAGSPIAGRLADRVNARNLASIGMAMCVVGLAAFAFLGPNTPWWYVITMLSIIGLGFALFASPITHAIMGSVESRYVGLAGATLATMRVSGQSISAGIATLVLALVVGRHTVRPVDYPHFLTSARITFAIFAALCVVGVLFSLVGPRRPGESAKQGT